MRMPLGPVMVALEPLVQAGWLVRPPDFDASKKYPLMLEIHGGPHSMYNVGFSFARQDHAANGFVLLYTNPRGSTGYGSAGIKDAYRSRPVLQKPFAQHDLKQKLLLARQDGASA